MNLPQRRLVVILSSLVMVTLACREEPPAENQQKVTFQEWTRANAIPLSEDPPKDASDMRRLSRTIRDRSIVSLGESSHGFHELLALRNRLFAFLVEEMGFTAIAAETGFAEGLEVNAYVLGGQGNAVVLSQRVFAWSPNAYAENRQLIEWMRHYNAARPETAKIRFYGIDLSGGRTGHFRESRRTVDAALAYLETIERDTGRKLRRRLEPELSKFTDQTFPMLPRKEQDEIGSAIGDLIKQIEQRRSDFRSTAEDMEYELASRHAVNARQLIDMFRVTPAASQSGRTADWRDALTARDKGMAENVMWVSNRERGVFVFAHNYHVQKGEYHVPAVPAFPISSPPTSMGQYLNSMIGARMFVIGSAIGDGEPDLKLAHLDKDSVDGQLGQVGSRQFFLNLHAVPEASAAMEWLNNNHRMRDNDGYGDVIALRAFDALVYVDRVRSVERLR